MKRIVTARYDLQGQGILRLARLALLGKYLPIGNLQGGPGARCLGVLLFLHYLGYPVYLLLARYGHRLQALRRWLRR
jgi:hypothetical protein